MKSISVSILIILLNLTCFSQEQDTVIYSDDLIDLLESKIDINFYESLPKESLFTEALPNIHRPTFTDSLIYVYDLEGLFAKIYQNYSGEKYLLNFTGDLSKNKATPFQREFYPELVKLLDSLKQMSDNVIHELTIEGIESKTMFSFRFNHSFEWIFLTYSNGSID